MADTFTIQANVYGKLGWKASRTTGLDRVTKDNNDLLANVALTDGDGDGEANRKYDARLSLSPESPTIELDLASLDSDAFGRTINFSAIKGLVIWNRGVPNVDGVYSLPDNFNVLVGGGDDTTFWASLFGSVADKIRIPPGGFITIGCPNGELAVGSASPGPGSILRLAYEGALASGSQIDIDIAIVGVEEEV